MNYKGYTGEATLDVESGIYFGMVDGIHDVITFQGSTVSEAAAAFRNSINVYLAMCQRRGEAPDEPPTEVVKLRLQPSLLRRANQAAADSGKTLNGLIAGLLQSEIPDTQPSTPVVTKTRAKRPASPERTAKKAAPAVGPSSPAAT